MNTDVVRSFVLPCLLSTLKHRCNDVLVPLQAQTTYISRGFNGLQLSFFLSFPNFATEVVELTTDKTDSAELPSSTDPIGYLCFTIILPKLLKNNNKNKIKN